jgi:signal transduction histidine kinase
VRLGRGLDANATAELSEQVLAVLREALSNVARHAGATRVDVTCEAGPDGLLTVLVRDNGRGIRPGARRSGLANMADRAVRLGGRLRIGSADGGGTELEWQVPVPPEPPAAAGDDPDPGPYPLR